VVKNYLLVSINFLVVSRIKLESNSVEIFRIFVPFEAEIDFVNQPIIIYLFLETENESRVHFTFKK
jgi:hypothetical protein